MLFYVIILKIPLLGVHSKTLAEERPYGGPLLRLAGLAYEGLVTGTSAIPRVATTMVAILPTTTALVLIVAIIIDPDGEHELEHNWFLPPLDGKDQLRESQPYTPTIQNTLNYEHTVPVFTAIT